MLKSVVQRLMDKRPAFHSQRPTEIGGGGGGGRENKGYFFIFYLYYVQLHAVSLSLSGLNE